MVEKILSQTAGLDVDRLGTHGEAGRDLIPGLGDGVYWLGMSVVYGARSEREKWVGAEGANTAGMGGKWFDV